MHYFDEIYERAGTNCYKWDTREQTYGVTDVTPLSVADMDLACPPVVMRALERRMAHPLMGYAVRPDSYYQAAMGWFERRFGWPITRESIVDTPGVVPALATAIEAYSKPGDGVLIQTPVYHPFFHIIRAAEREIVTNPLYLCGERYEIDFDDLDSKLRRANVTVMILCSPHNPVGRVWEEHELRRIADLCVKHGVMLLSDEIHADVVYPGHRHIPLASLDTGAPLLTAIAPSKTFNVAGLVTSLVVIDDEDLRKRFSDVLYRYALWLGNVFGIEALQAAYSEGDAWLDDLLVYLRGNLDLVKEYLPGRAPGIDLIEPEGTYVAWLDCRDLNLAQDELVKMFVKQAKVGLDNGVMFGVEGEGFMRLNFALPRPRLHEALERIAHAVQKG